MKTQTRLRIALIRPTKGAVLIQTIKAADYAWRTAIFGMGGSKKRIGGVKLGLVDGQPLALICELQTEMETPTGLVWTIETGSGLYAIAGPAAIFNDAGFGPASIGIDRQRLQSILNFNPEPKAMAEGLRRTLETRGERSASGPV